jgi:hypothetical protein
MITEIKNIINESSSSSSDENEIADLLKRLKDSEGNNSSSI